MKCRNVRGLIAASLYDDLTEAERTLLDGHLASCAACRAELDTLRKLTDCMADSVPPLDCDLLPAVRRRMAQLETEEDGGGRKRMGRGLPFILHPSSFILPRWRLGFAAAACLAVIAFVSYSVYGPSISNPKSQISNLKSQISPTATALDQAALLAKNRDFTGAFRLLKQAVQTHPDDPMAAEAQLRYADIAFSELHWYPEAHDAYNTLWKNYFSVFSASPESQDRFDLLDQCRDKDYAPLYALDAARRGTDDQFAQLEKVVARYPATFVAHLAANDMAQLAAEAALPAADTRVLAMERARDRCTDPVAVAQLKVELGQIYWKELNNPGKARDFFHEVAQSDNVVLAQLAKDALAGLK